MYIHTNLGGPSLLLCMAGILQQTLKALSWSLQAASECLPAKRLLSWLHWQQHQCECRLMLTLIQALRDGGCATQYEFASKVLGQSRDGRSRLNSATARQRTPLTGLSTSGCTRPSLLKTPHR